MDLITHIVAGGAVSATVTAGVAGRQRGWSPAGAAACGVAASIVMDGDELLPYRLKDEGLRYILYHRGHTHTIVIAAALGLLVAGLAYAIPSRFRPRFRTLALIGVAGALTHLLMDATNDYGVHPFWPLWNGWMRGKFIFLMEPLIWAPLLPLAFRPLLREGEGISENRLYLGVVGVLVAAVLAFIWGRFFQPLWMTLFSATLASVWILGQVVLQYRWRRPGVAWASVLLVWAVFLWGSLEARSKMTTASSGQVTVDLNTTPAPANPFCWRVIATDVDSVTGDITARREVVNLLPLLIPDACWLPPKGQATWTDDGRVVTPRATFEQLASHNCDVQAAEIYLQSPFLGRCADGRFLVGDLRIDYEDELTKYGKLCADAVKKEPCDYYMPKWIRPSIWER